MFAAPLYPGAAVLVQWEAPMKHIAAPDTGAREASNSLDVTSTYRFDGRTFVVQPVFQETGETSLATLLLNLMRTDASFQ